MKHTGPPRDVLDPIEIASRDEISALQLKRMKWSLRHPYRHSPLYQAAFDAAGVQPDDLRDLSDLARFPLTTKEDLRQRSRWGTATLKFYEGRDNLGVRGGLEPLAYLLQSAGRARLSIIAAATRFQHC